MYNLAEIPVKRWPGLIKHIKAATKVCPDTGCHVWHGQKNRNGYGRIKIGKRRIGAHKVNYLLTFGCYQKGLMLDHKCRNRACVNPLHLEPVTVQFNTLRGNAKLFTKKEKYWLQFYKAGYTQDNNLGGTP